MALATRSTFRPATTSPWAPRSPDAMEPASRNTQRANRLGQRHPRPARADLLTGPVLMGLTFVLWAATVADTARRLGEHPSPPVRVAGSVLIVVITFLMASSCLYLLARQGALLRFRWSG